MERRYPYSVLRFGTRHGHVDGFADLVARHERSTLRANVVSLRHEVGLGRHQGKALLVVGLCYTFAFIWGRCGICAAVCQRETEPEWPQHPAVDKSPGMLQFASGRAFRL